jgi:hypothetical protein
LAPGVGFEPTRPEGAQADRRAYSRHGPACYADCPVPGSGIPAEQPNVSTTIFPFGKSLAKLISTIQTEKLGQELILGSDKQPIFLEKINESGDGSGPANNP